MIPYPDISPDIVRIGPLTIRWYGMMYLLGFALSYFLVMRQIKKPGSPEVRKSGSKRLITKPLVEPLYSYLIVGLLLGARLGYVIFYNLPYYIQNPLEIFAVWHGGMSFHGGLIGCIFAGLIFCAKFSLDFWHVSDLISVTAPIGLGLGRVGNFLNGELYGRVTDVQWAMVFPTGGPYPRHPSQIYEFLLEGVVLFSILWILKDKTTRSGIVSSIFIMLYGLFRFVVEFFREPDLQVGFVFGHFTMGQQLSIFMIILGAIIYYRRRQSWTLPPD